MVSPAIKKISPLGDRAPYSGARVQLVEQPFLGKITLRGNSDNPAFLTAVRDQIGADLPLVPNTISTPSAAGVVLRAEWVGPDEWLLLCAEAGATSLYQNLSNALADHHAAVVDVSDYYTTIRLTGQKARDLLAKGCPLDLHPIKFGPGDCAGSVFMKAVIRLVQIDDGPSYDIQVRWSFADYLWKNLVQGAGEWG